MTGWRLGYMGAPKEIADACTKIQGQFTSGTSSITQKAAVTALKEDPKCLEDMRIEFQKRRDLIVELFKQIPGMKELAANAKLARMGLEVLEHIKINPELSTPFGPRFSEETARLIIANYNTAVKEYDAGIIVDENVNQISNTIVEILNDELKYPAPRKQYHR